MTKKIVLWVGITSTLLIASLVLFDSRVCYIDKYCNKIGDFINQDNLTVIFIMPFVFLFSLITYKMRDEIFRAWWNFARWFVPIIMFITFLIGFADTGGGVTGVAGDSFSYFILGVLYAIFVVTSLVKIIKAYRINQNSTK